MNTTTEKFRIYQPVPRAVIEGEHVTGLRRAIARRAARDFRWLMKTGTTPPIRKQRARWFMQALERRTNGGL